MTSSSSSVGSSRSKTWFSAPAFLSSFPTVSSCLDELGYLGLDRRGAELLVQVLTEREQRAALAVASNEPFSGWTKTFTDPGSARPSPRGLSRLDRRSRRRI